jgi:hypothetical protein
MASSMPFVTHVRLAVRNIAIPNRTTIVPELPPGRVRLAPV